MKWNFLWLTVLIIFIFSAGVVNATIVVPNSLVSTEGNTNNSWPFNLPFGGQTSMRYQQVYKATDFASLTGPAFITEISFRPDAFTGSAFSSTITDIRIDFSTTSAAPDALDTTFANNVGGDNTIVYSRGSLSLSSADTGPASGPKAFDIDIVLTTPFFYDPTLGNLLLDVRNFSGGSTTPFDADSLFGDPISRAFSLVSGGAGVGATTGFTGSLGLVTKFTVPEPATMFLLGTGLVGLIALRRRRKFSG